ncbi:hypothetical protein [Thalassobaculum fulvum]|uniref:hypothetical protein n=1 Tax=Thalassobaculum fulvum TaxID=1633335 RepID=UPI00167ACFB6|nr:hypothetical protein [Thalassobaculum fulvum]
MKSRTCAFALRMPPVFGRRAPLAAAAGALLLSGCGMTTHLHDEKLANLSTKLQSEFAAYQEDQPSLYLTMTANVAAFAKEEDATLERFADNVEAALLTKAPTLTFKEYEDRIKKKRAALDALGTEGSDALREDLKKRGGALTKRDDLDGVIKDFKAKIKAAEAQEKKWAAMIATFQDAIAALPAALDKLATGRAGLDALDSVFTTRDADTTALKDKLAGIARTELTDAPGIAVRILQLGLDLAELEREQAQLTLLALDERRKVYEDFAASVSVASSLLDKAEDYRKTATGLLKSASPTSRPAVAIIAYKTTPKSGEDVVRVQNIIHLLLMPPRLLVSADSLIARQDALVRLRLARLEHLDSIARSAVGDRANQAVISSGLDALVAYHAGGITEEDIANLIRVAQGVALFIIAA